MQKIDATNTVFILASDLVNHTARNIFLTGKASTGKTTFLRHIRETCPKRMAVVAPTGVAPSMPAVLPFTLSFSYHLLHLYPRAWAMALKQKVSPTSTVSLAG